MVLINFWRSLCVPTFSVLWLGFWKMSQHHSKAFQQFSEDLLQCHWKWSKIFRWLFSVFEVILKAAICKLVVIKIMTFSQLLVLLEAQRLLSCAECDRDIQTQTSAEHTNQTEDSGRICLIWNSLQTSFPFEGVVALVFSHSSLLASP